MNPATNPTTPAALAAPAVTPVWEVFTLVPAGQDVRRADIAHQLAKRLGTFSVYQGTPSLAFAIGDKASLSADWALSVAPQWANDARDALASIKEVWVKSAGEATSEAVVDGLRLTIPAPTLSVAAGLRLANMLTSKGSLIERATGVALSVERAKDTVTFTGRCESLDPDVAHALTVLASAMLESALVAKRVSPTPPAPGNDKYTMRCFLLRLGLIGAETKQVRKVLTRNLTGSAAWRTPPTTEKEQATVRVGARVRLIETQDPYTDLEPGALGTIALIDDAGTLHVDWDNGASLGLIPGVDRYTITK